MKTTEILPAKEHPLDWCFEKLCEQLEKHKTGDAQKRIMAHVRVRTGKNMPLPLFHKCADFDDTFKRDVYRECVTALINQDYTKLEGDVGQGDKTAGPPPAVEIKRATQPAKAESPTTTVRTVTPAKADTVTEPVAPVKPTPLAPLDPISAAMLTAMRPHIERLVDDRIAHGMSNGAFPTERVKELVGAMLQNVVTPAHITPEILAALQSLLTAIQHSLTATNTAK